MENELQPDGDAMSLPEEPADEDYKSCCDDGELAMEVDDAALPDKRPSVEEYKAKWEAEFQKHARKVPGDFAADNLVPEPIPQLWQDVPHVPFDKLVSIDAVSRLSRCRPLHGFTPAHVADNVVRFAHNTGEVDFRSRAPLQLASTNGFLLNARKGYFPGLTPEEIDALHECLTWMKQPGNNRVCYYGEELEIFDEACKQLMQKTRQFLPEGASRARISVTNRFKRKRETGVLGDTLGDEARGTVVVDYDGHPMKYDMLKVWSDVVATETHVVKVDAPSQTGRGWKRTHAEIDIDKDLGEEWKAKMSRGSTYMLKETYVKANDPHYDAKCFPHMYPYDWNLHMCAQTHERFPLPRPSFLGILILS